MKLTDKAKFKEMEIAGSKRIKNSSELDLTVYNGSQGINRGYTDKNNNFTQDKLPRYTIDSWSAVITMTAANKRIFRYPVLLPMRNSMAAIIGR